MRTCQLMRLTCELPFHCLARSCHLEVLMVISIDSLLIKQLRKLLNVILVISLFTWQDVWRDNSILENMSSWHLYWYILWPISQILNTLGSVLVRWLVTKGLFTQVISFNYYLVKRLCCIRQMHSHLRLFAIAIRPSGKEWIVYPCLVISQVGFN